MMNKWWEKIVTWFKAEIVLPEADVEEEEEPIKTAATIFSTDLTVKPLDHFALMEMLQNKFQLTGRDFLHTPAGIAMDDTNGIKTATTAAFQTMSPAQMHWYISQAFIGYQLCAILAQQWLVSKACTQPAKDAIRKGYKITINNGNAVNPEIEEYIRELDTNKFKIMSKLREFISQSRVFGIRIALFKVDSTDPNYYFKPFNIDGVKPGSYKGIVQIDPFWISPELDAESSADPLSLNFYEPTWWRVGAERIHRSHLIIARGEEVADILKPSYLYGGISIPQKIYERVYAAERTANEGPMLALTKRLNILKTDLTKIVGNQAKVEERLNLMNYLRDNFGTRLIGEEEEIQQLDTTLADLDSVIMNQYQLVSAASNVPATKLLGTQPKGFNATGDYEEAAYHQELESIQTHDATPFLDRHYLLLAKSDLEKFFNIKQVFITIKWNPLDAITEKEQAEINEIKSRTDANYATAGALDGTDIRGRLVIDSSSGYSGIEVETGLEDEEINEEFENEFGDAPKTENNAPTENSLGETAQL